jgi:hypothetical protein
MRALVKKHAVQVRLSDRDAADLAKAARVETKRRGEIVGDATLLRELAMPRVRELLTEAEKAAA